MIDAQHCEYAFAYLLGHGIGERGKANDSDIFREGSPADLHRLLDQTASAVRDRINNMTFSPADADIANRLNAMASGITSVKASITKREPQDYHWELVATFVGITSALFDYIDSRHE